MPNYRYKCGECGLYEEFTLRMSSDPKQLMPCPTCETDSMGRVMSRIAGFNMHGSINTVGKWYKNETGRELLSD